MTRWDGGSPNLGQAVPAARHIKHACSCMTPACDTACPKLGLSPCPTLSKEAMGLRYVSDPSLWKDRSVPLKPCGKTLKLPSLQGRSGEVQPEAACLSRDHLQAPQHSKGIFQSGLQQGSKTRCVLQEGGNYRKSYGSCLALCPASSSSQLHIRGTRDTMH